MAVESSASGSDMEQEIIKYVMSCRDEAKQAKEDRMDLNEDNFAMFQLKHDFSHKEEGQSTEVLPKLRMAVLQIQSFFQQAIADVGEWFEVEPTSDAIPEEALLIKPHELSKLITFMHMKSNYYTHVGNAVQSGILGALITTKTSGCMKPYPKFTKKTEGRGKNLKKHVVKVDDKSWELKLDVVRQENYYPDPTGEGLYEIEEMYQDLHRIIALSEGENAIYDPEVVEQLSRAQTVESLEEQKKSIETGQNITNQGHRPKVKLTEFWGSVVNSKGEIEHENVVITIANDRYMIRKPTPNPLWFQESPFTKAGLLEVANSVWPMALADAGTKLNRTIIEMHNLILDAAFKHVHAISQIRIDDLVDPTQVSEGIPAGTKLAVKRSLPHNARVMEPLEDTNVPNDAITVLNIEQQEFNAAMLTNDLRQGVMPTRAVKATEVVEASQTITSIFQGIAKNIETKFIEPELYKHMYTICQNWDLISKEVFISLFGIERGTELSQLDPQDVFVAVVNAYRFRVYGVSQKLSKATDYRKYTTLLQTIGASDILIEEFLRKYNFGKLLGEIMSSLDIDKHKIANPQNRSEESQGGLAALAGGPGMGPNGDMSRVPSAQNSAIAEIFGNQGLPRTEFPQQPGGF